MRCSFGTCCGVIMVAREMLGMCCLFLKEWRGMVGMLGHVG